MKKMKITKKVSNKKKRKAQIITYRKNFNYSVLLKINQGNKNYVTIKKIEKLLKKTNKTWSSIVEEANITEASMKTYLYGKEKITLRSIEKMALIFKGVIKSPRELMNLNTPVLKGGEHFKLNIKEIMKKYRINRGDLSLSTGINNGSITNYFNGKTTQIRIETLNLIFNYFKECGVPLNNIADLIYFPEFNETPFHFLLNKKSKNLIPKFNTQIKN
jgi:transcriptional regulator with XRE-family HTH domain